ncbi:MAG TPA: hypothetical protein VH207_12890, partial [Chthoniobacterales bacterium]|nr:hypothetical protein [Chthoniobacterales bacterium]
LIGENESTVLLDATLIVDSGAVLTLDTLRVGGGGNGILNIGAGGSAMIGDCLIGNGAGHGTVMLSGPNAELTGESIQLGFNGLGTLTLSGGASVTSGVGTVGEGSDVSGATIQGAGSKWTIGLLDIRSSTVTVQDNGVVDAQGKILIGVDPTRNILNQEALMIEAGGLVQTPAITIRNGFASVSGQGATSSRLDVTDLLSIGGLLDLDSFPSDLAASIEISGGATVVAQRLGLGDSSGEHVAGLTISGVGGNGQASLLNVVGPNSQLVVAGAAGIKTLLDVTDGGMLSSGSDSSSDSIGDGSLAGTVLIRGKNGSQPSTWSISANNIPILNIGSQIVPSELVVQDGGIIVAGADSIIAVAQPVRELGDVTVTGAGSSIAADAIIVGADGDGTVTISDAGSVTTAVLRVGSDQARIVGGGPGRGIELLTITGTPLSSSEWHATSTAEIGLLEPSTLRLEGTMIGPFSVGGATLRVDNMLTVGPKGFVRGSGTIVATKVIGHNIGPDVDVETPVRGQAMLAAAPLGGSSFLSSGSAGGIIVIEGNYEQPAGGKLTIDTAGLGDGEFDVLHVTGNATLGGTLEMLFPGTYLPKAGDSFKFLLVDGTISGEFAEVTFPQLLPGFQFDVMQVSGGLLFTALNDAVLAPTFLLIISTRLQVGTDDNVLIGGFILQGTEPKRVLIRAVGPSLAALGLSGAMADPTLELHDSTGAVIGQNDDWRETQTGGLITDDQFFEIFATGIPPTSFEESAIVATLEPGAYTAILAGADGGTGIGLVEVYDLGPAATPAKLANISTRGFVQTGDDVMIGGFIIGNQISEVLVRGIGPSLAPFGIDNALADPLLELHDGNGDLLASNDNWRSDQETEIEATDLAPDDDAESAILRSLVPGAYTAILRGVADTTGVGLVEAYQLE